MYEVKTHYRNLHLLGRQMQQKNALMFDFGVNSKHVHYHYVPKSEKQARN